MKLFMIGVGGHMNSNIEVHDVLFIVGENFEDTFEEIRNSWYGVPNSLHIDSYKVLSEIDGFEVVVGGNSTKQLFFVNYGGYTSDIFGEIHKNTFLVAENKDEAEEIAKLNMNKYANMNHLDTITNVSKMLSPDFELGFKKKESSFNESPDWQGYIKL